MYTNLSSQDTQLLKPTARLPTKCASFSQPYTRIPYFRLIPETNHKYIEVPEQCLITNSKLLDHPKKIKRYDKLIFTRLIIKAGSLGAANTTVPLLTVFFEVPGKYEIV